MRAGAAGAVRQVVLCSSLKLPKGTSQWQRPAAAAEEAEVGAGSDNLNCMPHKYMHAAGLAHRAVDVEGATRFNAMCVFFTTYCMLAVHPGTSSMWHTCEVSLL